VFERNFAIDRINAEKPISAGHMGSRCASSFFSSAQRAEVGEAHHVFVVVGEKVYCITG